MLGNMDFVVRGGRLLTMDPELGEPAGDLRVVDGRIAAVGGDITGSSTVDATGAIVLPGFVETHWHLWNTLLRGRSGARGYFRTSTGLGRECGPDDVYEGTRRSCRMALRSGMTFVHDWCHNVAGPAHARAAIRALEESGLRGRFSYGYAAGHPSTEPMDLADLRSLASTWDSERLSLGVAWRGQGGSDPAMRVPAEVYRRELDAARELGLPVSVHAGGPRFARGQIAGLAGLLGPDVQVVHANNATDREIELVAEAGAVVSLSPLSELRIGYGFPRTGDLLAAGIAVGLSVDTTMLTGEADMFRIMQTVLGVANALAEDEFALTPRRVLELATIEGARSMGLGDEIGSLRVGKRADLIVVSQRDWAGDPAEFLVTVAQPADEHVPDVGGRALDGR
jgi:5-methylthioadenosine/S-adenosylhomocysteine deaminase